MVQCDQSGSRCKHFSDADMSRLDGGVGTHHQCVATRGTDTCVPLSTHPSMESVLYVCRTRFRASTHQLIYASQVDNPRRQDTSQCPRVKSLLIVTLSMSSDSFPYF